MPKCWANNYCNDKSSQCSPSRTFKNVTWNMISETMSAYPGVSHFELSQDILGHVILGHWVHHKVLVSGRPFCWPVLVAFFLQGVKNRIPQWATTFPSYTSFIVFIPRNFVFVFSRLNLCMVFHIRLFCASVLCYQTKEVNVAKQNDKKISICIPCPFL